jgi:hypothetical protein
MNKYLRHIINLCRYHSITIYTGDDYRNYMMWCYDKSKEIMVDLNPTPTFCLVGTCAIFVPIIHNKHTYFEALHEIGHIVMQKPKDGWQLYAAIRLKKVTKSMLKSEQRASTFHPFVNSWSVPIKRFDNFASTC